MGFGWRHADDAPDQQRPGVECPADGHPLVEHPEIHVVEEFALPTARLDTLLAGTPHRFDFVNLDIQGAELRALRGLGDRLRGVRWIYCEVMEKPLYIGAPLVGELDAYRERMRIQPGRHADDAARVG